MTQQIINIGAAEEDGTGDHLRVAFDKSNQNFTELYGAGSGFQPLDADLTAIAALTETNTIYYRSGTDTWSPVTIGAGLNFATGTLTNTGGSGGAAEYVFNTNTSAPPSSGQIRLNNATQSSATIIWVHNVTNGGVDLKRALETTPIGAKLVIQDQDDSSKYANYQVAGALIDGGTYWEIPITFLVGGSALANQQRTMLSIQMGASYASLDSPTFTGDPKAPTPATGDNDTSIATTAFVKAQSYITSSALASYAPLASPALSGNPTAPTPTAGDNDTSIATTAFVTAAVAGKADTSALAAKADLASPTFTGDPKAPTPATADNDTSIATTAFVKIQGYAIGVDVKITTYTAGSGTHTLDSKCTVYVVELVGGGGGGSAGGAASAAGSVGGDTTWGGLAASGGNAAQGAYSGPSTSGGNAGGGVLCTSNPGHAGTPLIYGTTSGAIGGNGGSGPWGGAGRGVYAAVGENAAVGSGSGGAGGAMTAVTDLSGAGGGAGAYVRFASVGNIAGQAVNYVVGAGGAPGAATVFGGFSAGAGGSGRIIVTEYLKR